MVSSRLVAIGQNSILRLHGRRPGRAKVGNKPGPEWGEAGAIGCAQTSLAFVRVDVLRSHELTYERRLAHSSGAQQGHGVRRDTVVPPLRLVVVIVRHGRRALLGVVVPGQAVAPRPTFPERVAPVDDAWKTRDDRVCGRTPTTIAAVRERPV